MGKIHIGCQGVIKKNGKILLGIRNKPTNSAHGLYSTVGGGVHFLEKTTDAICRETKEETNIDLNYLKLFKVYERLTQEKDGPLHRLVFLYQASYAGGALKGGDDCINPQFYSIHEIKGFIAQGKLDLFVVQVLKDLGEV
ncbi:MAG: NUDIX hydrolase [Alphaproteobacteria bacterium]|nr:NUDIX hydrolase [Alphaproteobacteria bacterium]MBN2780053.1 NUDIX hydrolase [Alphaproteobacteria bacterium]